MLPGAREGDAEPMRVEQLMSRDVVSVTPETPLKDVARLLVEHGVSGLPVVAAGHVVGVVSESDIVLKERGRDLPSDNPVVRLLERLPDPSRDKLEARTAGDAMTSPALVVRPGAGVAEAATTMTRFKVDRLPVVDGGRLVGIVTRADLVRAFARTDEEIEEEIADDILLRTLWMDPARVRTTVEGGRVTLEGHLENQTLVDLLPALVERVPGVVSVESHLSTGVERHSLIGR